MTRHVVRPEEYWEKAGVVSYARAMFASAEVERHINRRVWDATIDIARALGVGSTARVLDLGCGDGMFANQVLAHQFGAVHGLDKAAAAISRAAAAAPAGTVSFEAADLVSYDYGRLGQYDAVFVMGFLHHVKFAAPALVARLPALSRRIIVMEPNGGHLVRKALEMTPAYRRAGEDSFRSRDLIAMFERAGYRLHSMRRMNIFPNFTPELAFRLLLPLERIVENSVHLNRLCTVGLYGFELV